MYKSKKWMAATLAAAMVMGSSITVFATGTTPATSGSTTGGGTSEGHVEKEVVNMVLPTIPSGSTPFAYTMDPERLIQETGGAKYEDFTFPAADSDTGVYFLTGEKTYANTSNTLQAINKSSCDVTLTVKVKATQNTAKDITLATSTTLSTTDPELYLGLKVGTAAQAVSTTEATVTKTVAGAAGNFETVYDATESKYKYQEKASATTWKAINISMTGAVNEKAIAADTTAPTVEVTWSYAKAADGATVDTGDQVDYTAAPANSAPSIAVTNYTISRGQDVTVNVNLGSGTLAAEGISSITYQNGSGATTTLAQANYTFSNGVLTIKSNYIDDLFTYNVTSRVYTIIFDDTAATTKTITLAQ